MTGSPSPNGSMRSEPLEKKGTPSVDDPLSFSFENYVFPHSKLRTTLDDPRRIPLVLVACGSFSPPTYLHLRMFELAADYARDNTHFEVIGAYMSPVNANYKKEGLVGANDRLKMCSLATKGHDWLSVDDWEGLAPKYVPTAQVLDHFDEEIKKLGPIEAEDGTIKPVRVALLAGADLISTFATPGLWSQQDLDHILGKFGCFILERAGVDIDDSLENLNPWISNIWFIDQPIQNDVSSTKIRLFLGKNKSIRYLIPTSVINYIYENELYNAQRPLNGHSRTPSNSRIPISSNDEEPVAAALGSSHLTLPQNSRQ